MKNYFIANGEVLNTNMSIQNQGSQRERNQNVLCQGFRL